LIAVKRVSADQCHQQTKTGGEVKKKTNKQTGEEREKDKGGGGRVTNYKPKSIARYKSAKWL